MNSQILGVLASPYNDLAIPVIMGPTMIIVRGMSFGLFALFFLAEALRLQVLTVQHAIDGSTAKPPLKAFLFKSLILFVSMCFLYKWIFLKMVVLCDYLALALSNEEQWDQFLIMLTQNSNVSTSFFNMTAPLFIGAVAMTILKLIGEIFTTLRFVFLSFLYVVGPICWAFGLSTIGGGVVKGWFKMTWHVAFWVVVFAVLKSALIPLGAFAFQSVSEAAGGGALGAAAAATNGGMFATIYTLVFIIVVSMIPSLTAAIFSDGNFGAVAAATTTSFLSYQTYRDLISHATNPESIKAIAGAAGTVGGFVRGTYNTITAPAAALASNFRQRFTPQTADQSGSGSTPPSDRTR